MVAGGREPTHSVKAMNKTGKSKNRFDVQAVFKDFSFGIKNRPDVELTPADVAASLEEFCQRIRKVLADDNELPEHK